MNKLWVKVVIVILIIVGVGLGVYFLINRQQKINSYQDKYQIFVAEVYEKIQTNYWEKISDNDLSSLFLLATNKVLSKNLVLKTPDKNGVLMLINDIENKDNLPLIVDMVLANLKPFSRSRLYSQKEEKSLVNTVNNVNPESDYFSKLGLGKSATTEEVVKKYEESTKTPEIEQAYKVLKNADSRQIYAISGVEPTIEYKLLTPSIYYVHMTKFSPTSLEEFVRVMNKVADKADNLDTLIFDLRGNIGGAIDQLPYFLGPFIGYDNYAYQFYQQGNKDDFKTATGWLDSMVRYKKVVILIDENTQSTAEVTAAVLKKYNVGVVVGNTTKGWGTIEKVFPLDNQIKTDEKFSLFLVHHVTIADDGQSIEGRGIVPHISIKNPNWKKELLSRFGNQEIVDEVGKILSQ
jgi:hypothetical protein